MSNEEEILQKLNTLSVVLLGVPGTESTGLVGDIKTIIELQKKTNGAVQCHGRDIAKLKIMVYILATLGIGGTVVTRLLGV